MTTAIIFAIPSAVAAAGLYLDAQKTRGPHAARTKAS